MVINYEGIKDIIDVGGIESDDVPSALDNEINQFPILQQIDDSAINSSDDPDDPY